MHGRQNAKFISILDDQQQPIQYGHHQHLQYTSVVGLTILTRHYSHNRLRMVQKKDTGEVCHVRIFADYWLINKTGIRLHYLQVRTSTAHVSCLLASSTNPCSCRTQGDQHERTRIPGQPKMPPAHAARRLEGDPRNWYAPLPCCGW